MCRGSLSEIQEVGPGLQADRKAPEAGKNLVYLRDSDLAEDAGPSGSKGLRRRQKPDPGSPEPS